MRHRVAVVLAMASFFMAGLALAQDAAPAPDASAVRPVQLSKVILDSETHPITYRLKGGTLCVFPDTTEFPKERKTQDYERFDVLFGGALKKQGFTVVSTSQDLFASEAADAKGDILIGATMIPEAVNLCSSVNGWKGDLTIAVEWQIFDRKAQKVVESARTSARAELLKFATDGYTTLWNQAFVANLEALLRQGTIQKYAGTPAVPANSPASPPPAPSAPPAS